MNLIFIDILIFGCVKLVQEEYFQSKSKIITFLIFSIISYFIPKVTKMLKINDIVADDILDIPPKPAKKP